MASPTSRNIDFSNLDLDDRMIMFEAIKMYQRSLTPMDIVWHRVNVMAFGSTAADDIDLIAKHDGMKGVKKYLKNIGYGR